MFTALNTLIWHRQHIWTHTFSKSDRRVSMSVVMEGMLSTHWQYSRIILINSNTVLQERKQPNTLSLCTDEVKKQQTGQSY